MRVLAVGAYPDDLEIFCAGTLAKFKKNGAKIFMAHLCNGYEQNLPFNQIKSCLNS